MYMYIGWEVRIFYMYTIYMYVHFMLCISAWKTLKFTWKNQNRQCQKKEIYMYMYVRTCIYISDCRWMVCPWLAPRSMTFVSLVYLWSSCCSLLHSLVWTGRQRCVCVWVSVCTCMCVCVCTIKLGINVASSLRYVYIYVHNNNYTSVNCNFSNF